MSKTLAKPAIRYFYNPFTACLIILTAINAYAEPIPVVPPSYLTLPASVLINPDSTKVMENYGQAEFYEPGSDDSVLKVGKHWHLDFIVPSLPEDSEGKAVWATIKPSLVSSGWNIPIEYDSNPFSVMFRYQKDGKDTWAYLKIFGSNDLRFDLVEVRGSAQALSIPKPNPTPEHFSSDKGDFPYLLPFPGSMSGGSAGNTGTMLVTLPGSEETQLVGQDSITKSYFPPATLSNLEFVSSYHNALEANGWTIISESQGVSQTDATLTVHYDKDGRDIWAYLHMGGSDYSIQVSDSGVDQLTKEFAASCHIPLYGVHFDFNKSTLKPESDAVLENVQKILQSVPPMKVEVQGHTDNIGNDDYNQKLSESRAKSVMDWLASHSIDASRLTAKGYGRSVPVASNDDDEGRAKNRRVEIAKIGCVK